MFALLLPITAGSADAAQRSDVRADARIYFDAERLLRGVEIEASCSGYYPDILHRVINMRAILRPLRRFANREGAVDGLNMAVQDEKEICVGLTPSALAPHLREARRDIELLRQRARRARWRDLYLDEPN